MLLLFSIRVATCFGKSCSFRLLCVSFMNAFILFRAGPFPFGMSRGR